MPDVPDPTFDELVASKTQIDDEIAAIKSQLTRARARRFTDGVFADADWYARAITALRMKGRDSQRIQERLAQMRREKKAENIAASAAVAGRWKAAFVAAARERLPLETFVALAREADRRVSEQSGDDAHAGRAPSLARDA